MADHGLGGKVGELGRDRVREIAVGVRRVVVVVVGVVLVMGSVSLDGVGRSVTADRPGIRGRGKGQAAALVLASSRVVRRSMTWWAQDRTRSAVARMASRSPWAQPAM